MGLLIKQLEQMDKASEEFFEIYKLVNEKYWQIDDPDEYQKAAMMINLVANQGEEWHVSMIGRLAIELFQMVEKDIPAIAGSFVVKNKDVHFNFCTDKNALGNLEKVLRNTVMVKVNESKESEP